MTTVQALIAFNLQLSVKLARIACVPDVPQAADRTDDAAAIPQPSDPASPGATTPAIAVPTSAGWPGPSWPTIQPSIRIPLRPHRDGDGGNPWLTFNPSGTRVLVDTSFPRFWSWQTLRWHSPDLAAITLLLALAWVARTTYRGVRAHFDQRIADHWYCRTCGYDLTPPGTNADARTLPPGLTPTCSECGVTTAKRRPRRHVRPRAALFKPLVTLILVSAAAAWIFATTLQTVPMSMTSGDLWPSPLIGRLLTNCTFLPPLTRLQYGARYPDANEVSVFELPTGRRLAQIGTIPNLCSWQFVTDDFCVGTNWGMTPDVSGIATLDLRATPPRVHRFPLPGHDPTSVLYSTSDSRVIHTMELARADGLPWNLAVEPYTLTRATADVALRFWSLDLDSGTWALSCEIPIHLDRPRLRWGLQFCGWRGQGRQATTFTAVLQKESRPTVESVFVVFSVIDGVLASRTITGPAGMNLGANAPESDGVRLRLTTPSGAIAYLDTHAGTIVTPSPKPWAIETPDGLLSFQYPAMPPRFVRPDGTVAAVPCIGAAACFPTIDARGRWLWMVDRSTWPPPWLVDAVGYRLSRANEAVLWDLEPVKQRARSTPKPPLPVPPTSPSAEP